MKYIFFGTPEFAAIILEKLIEAGFIPEAVVCNPDKPAGRKKTITPPTVKKMLIEKFKDLKIEILQPEKLNTHNMDNKCDRTDCPYYNCDIFIVAAYNKIIPKEILEIPRLGTIGVHPSLLPKYRGASPIQSVILNGEIETGTTLYLMDEKVDHGPILAQQKLENCELKIINYKLLQKKLAELSANLLIENLLDIKNKIKSVKIQDESLATYTKKFTAEDAFIKPEYLEKAQNEGGEIAIKIEQKIRALNPEPGPWTFSNNKRMKILEAELSNGKLKLVKIQTEGKKPILIG